MDIKTEQLLIVAVLLVLLGEVTYLVAKLPRQVNGKKKYIFVDTSVLIDGRILSIASSGFIGDTLAIPRSVIGELQFLADNADAEKRARARHGLDVARELQGIEGLSVELFQDGSKAEEGVDERLLNLAKKHGGAICTIDYNLNKVAAVEGIKVCNVNELAKNLRMAYLPGEKMLLELVQKGQDNHQAVGYLKDGTMVVVEQSAAFIGKTIEVEFIRSLQTAAGKMMFARPVELPQKQKPQQQLAKKVTGTKPLPQPQSQPQQQPKPVTLKPKQPVSKPKQHRQPQQQQSAQPKSRPAKRPARMADREAAMIDLVNKQS